MAHAGWLRACLFIVTLFAAASSSARFSPAEAAPPEERQAPAARAGVVVVRLNAGKALSDIAEVLSANGASFDRAVGRGGVVRLRLPEGSDGSALVAALRANPAVAEAGYDLVVKAFDAPNDPAYPRQWHLHATTGGIDVEGAWEQSPARGAGVVVAVIDTGVAYEARTGEQGLFGPKMFGRAPDLAGVPIVAPWDWIGGDSHANDEHGHGTHVSSTILQGAGNGVSGAGVSAASLMPLRILDFSGNGQATDLVDAIYYAADNGAQVINMSLGFTGTGAPDANGNVCTEIIGLGAALEYADAMGVAVIAAAGNDGGPTVACPAAYPTVIAVAATRFDGSVTFYSNRGAALDVSAPGGDPNVDQNGDGEADQVIQQSYCLDPFLLLFTGSYDTFCDMPSSGTSMASPHVAGTAAIMKAQHPTLSPAQIREILQQTARDRGAPGWDSEYGHGVIDASAALGALIAAPPPAPPPGPPPVPRPVPQPGVTNLSATPLGVNSIRLNWTDNATGETGFRIDRSGDGGLTWVQAGIATANAVTFTNYNLSPNTQYHYRARSYDSLGSSPWSAVVSATTLPPPAAPTGAAATPLSATSIRVSWVDNSTTEQGFKVERSTDGATFVVGTYAVKNAVSVTVNSLSPGTNYWFRVRAYEGSVNGEASNVAQAMTFALPAAPANLIATTLNTTTIRLDWTDMSTTEQGFRIERSLDGGTTWAQAGLAAANTITWTNWNLTPNTSYSYRVRGYDGILNGAPSNVATTTTTAPPAAPTNVSATPVNTTKIRIDWVDASSNEQGFKIERSPDGGATWTLAGTALANSTTYTAVGLAPGSAYSFRVRAYEGATNGPFSEIVSASTMDAPSAPTGLAGTPLGSTSIRLTWTNTSAIQTSVKLERSLDGVAWTQIAMLPPATVAFTSSALLPGTTYSFRIRAAETNTNGPYSDVTVVSTFPPASAPANLTLTQLSATAVKLTWTDTCTYETGFRIERSLDGVTWTQIVQMGANSTTWSNFGLAAGTTYHYRIRAYDGLTNGQYSEVVTFTAP